MPSEDKGHYKYVFVCGLQRSGTTILGRNIARLEGCTGFENTPRSIDVVEGQKLQDIYPLAFEYGGPGKFGFDPRAHLTENSDLLTPVNVSKLRESWHAYWDKRKTICVEKTPANLLMTRFLQAAFPNSYFIVIRRHPVAVSMATQRMWDVKRTSLHSLFQHWLHCHRLFDEDKKYLRNIYELTYEDYIKNPGKYHDEIASFIGTSCPKAGMEEITGTHNKRYLDKWSDHLTKSTFRGYYRYIARNYEPRFIKYGYSLLEASSSREEVLPLEGKVFALGGLYCIGADACAFLSRFMTLDPKKQIKALLPQSILVRLKRVRHRALLRKEKASAISPSA